MSEHAFDPEVVALLDEIARSSGSSLLRTPKERLLKWVGRPEEVISPHGSYLSKAERHLVTAYREAAAWVLHSACIAQLAGQPESRAFVESSRRPDVPQVERRASRLAEIPHLLPSRVRDRLLDPSVSASALAAAALRLVPADLTRIALGVSYHAEGYSSAAIRVFNQVLSRQPPNNVRRLAEGNLGSVHCANGNYARALESYSKALRAAEGQWKTVIFRMIAALQLGQEVDAIHSAKELGCIDVRRDWLDELVQYYERTRLAGDWILTQKAYATILKLQDSLPENARRVCDALHPFADA